MTGHKINNLNMTLEQQAEKQNKVHKTFKKI